MLGQHDYRLESDVTGIKGYDWVGWEDGSLGAGAPVTMVFKFDSVRNFTAAWFHCNNMYDKDVRVFRMAKVRRVPP